MGDKNEIFIFGIHDSQRLLLVMLKYAFIQAASKQQQKLPGQIVPRSPLSVSNNVEVEGMVHVFDAQLNTHHHIAYCPKSIIHYKHYSQPYQILLEHEYHILYSQLEWTCHVSMVHDSNFGHPTRPALSVLLYIRQNDYS